MSIAYPPERPQSIYSSILQHKVQTIGYRAENGLAEIERIMSAEPSTLLVDIRYKPASHNLQWTKQAFSKKYQDRYIWIEQLGNVNYQQHGNIQIADAQSGIERLISLLQEHNVLLMCGCSEYETCHRKVIYELLQEALLKKAACFYVDDLQIYPDKPHNHREWCHLATTGSIDDLHAFAQKIGLKREWFQNKPNHPHYDLTKGKRAAAIKHGAIATDTIELIKACHPRLAAIASNTEAEAAEPPTNIHMNNLTVQVTEDAQQVKEVKAACFLLTEEELRAENTRLLAAVDFERNKHYEWRARCLLHTEQPAEGPDPQIAARLVLDQEEQIHIISAENTRYRERETKTLRIITRQRQQVTTLRNHLNTALAAMGITLDELLDKSTPPKMIPIAAYQQEKERASKTEQRLQQVRKSPFKTTERLLIDELQYQADNPNARRDADGYIAICQETAAKHLNISPSSVGRGIEAIQKQWPNMPAQFKKVPERTRDGREIERLHFKPQVPSIIPHALRADLSQTKIEQGGDRFTCQKCGKSHVHRDTYKKVLLVCDDCGHKSILEETKVTIDYPNATYTKQDAAKHDAIKCRLQANITINQPATCNEDITIDPPSVCADVIHDAATLLLEIAGPHEKHIIMPQHHEKKYLEVKRPLTLDDMIDHLTQGEARGAPCSYENGQTRILCKDADIPEDWQIFESAAKKLVQHGYIPLLEASPARYGHFWIIFDTLVDAAAAWEAVYQIAPELRDVKEYWPAPIGAKNWNRVRLPGAYYSRKDGPKGWCIVTNVVTGESSQDGESAAALLLSSLTPVAKVCIPECARQDDPQPAARTTQKENEAPTAPTIARSQDISQWTAREQELGYRLPVVDEAWRAKNGDVEKTTYYFAITASYAVHWFNEHNALEEIHPKECNGMALSPNGSERTASTSYHINTHGEERFTDHSQHGKRADGTKDSGDALELACKVRGVTKDALLAKVTSEIVRQGTSALENAARAGNSIPNWLESPDCIITPAGRKHYRELREGKNGQRGASNRLGKRGNNISESSRNGARVPEPARGEDRDAGKGVLEAVRRAPGNDAVGARPGSGESERQRASRTDTATHGQNSQAEQHYQHAQNVPQQGEKNPSGTFERVPDLRGSSREDGRGTLAADTTGRTAGANHRGAGNGDTATQKSTPNTATTIERSERELTERPAKLGTCLVEGYKTNTPCGSTRWHPVPSEEGGYICVMCLTPIAATWRIEAKKRKDGIVFPTHENM